MTEAQKSELVILRKKNRGIISNKPCFEGFAPIKNSQTNLFWPCIMYQVEIQVDKSELDIFERTILKLADCNITKAKDIAYSMNMEVETIAFIQNRLVIKGYLKDRLCSITDKGHAYLDEYINGNHTEAQVICLFKDINSGEFIDLVEVYPAKNTLTIYSEKNGTLEGAFNLPGNERKKGFVVISTNYEKAIASEPEAYLLLRAIRKYNKAVEKELKISLSKISNSVKVKSKELVFVHTVGFATANGEIHSTDAAGIGISDIFTDFIRNANDNEHPWIRSIFEKGNAKINNEEEESDNKHEKPRFSYPAVSNPIFNAVKAFNEIKSVKVENHIAREDMKRSGEIIYYNIFTALEYALKMYYADFKSREKEDVTIQLADQEARQMNKTKIKEVGIAEDNIFLFYILAQNLSINLPHNYLTLLKVYPGKIKSMRDDNQPELIPLLCLCLANAIDDPEVPLSFLAKNYPDFMIDFFKLKELRDKTSMAHGPGLTFSDVSASKCKEIIEKIVFYVEYLNEKLKVDNKLLTDYFKDDIHNSKYQYSSYIQKIYEKKLELYKDYGYVTINKLPANLIKQMVNSLITFGDLKYVAGSACSVLQQFFEYSITAMLKYMMPPAKEQRNCNFVAEKCINVCFELKNNKLPDSISTVSYKKIGKAVCGGGCDSLGAGIISFLILVPENQLMDISQQYPRFILDLDFLLKSRGHSDVREYSEREVSIYKKIVTTIIKILIKYID